jgi:hypothetical protein
VKKKQQLKLLDFALLQIDAEAMVFLKKIIDNNKKDVNLAIRLHRLEQQEEKSNNNQPFCHSVLQLSILCFRVN